MVECVSDVCCLPVASWAVLAQALDLTAGGYFSWVKILFMFLVPLPLYYLAPLVHKDAAKIHVPQAPWCAGVLGAAVVGMMLWLVLPFYLVGMMIFLVLTTGVLLAYVVYRNNRVPDDLKILTTEHLRSLLGPSKRGKVEVVTRLKLYRSDGNIHHPPSLETSPLAEIETYNLVQELLHDVVWRRASEADISPAGATARVRFVIDGVVVERTSMDLADSEALIEYLKPISGMDPEEHRRPQQGKISVDLAARPIDMDLTAAGTTGGQRLRIRIVQEVVQTDLNLLGLSEDVIEKVRAMNHAGHGLLIVSGKPGNGITSTLYSLLREHDAFIKHLATLEIKPSIDVENVTQNAYGEEVKLPGMLASVLRRDPDVLMVDRSGDRESAQLLHEAAAEKTILLGMHGGDTFTALAKWVKAFGQPAEAVENLRGVLCQVLLRKLCPTCREAYRPNPQLLAKINLPAEGIDQFFRPPTSPLTDEKGNPYVCPTCQGSGYFGRTAAFELLEINDDIRRLVVAGAGLSKIKSASRKSGMLYLQEQALRKVITGETSIQEVIRVSQKPQKR